LRAGPARGPGGGDGRRARRRAGPPGSVLAGYRARPASRTSGALGWILRLTVREARAPPGPASGSGFRVPPSTASHHAGRCAAPRPATSGSRSGSDRLARSLHEVLEGEWWALLGATAPQDDVLRTLAGLCRPRGARWSASKRGLRASGSQSDALLAHRAVRGWETCALAGRATPPASTAGGAIRLEGVAGRIPRGSRRRAPARGRGSGGGRRRAGLLLVEPTRGMDRPSRDASMRRSASSRAAAERGSWPPTRGAGRTRATRVSVRGDGVTVASDPRAACSRSLFPPRCTDLPPPSRGKRSRPPSPVGVP